MNDSKTFNNMYNPKFKPGDLVRLNTLDITRNVVLYLKLYGATPKDITRRDASEFINVIGEIVEVSQYEYIVWWPTLGGYNFFTGSKLKFANAT